MDDEEGGDDEGEEEDDDGDDDAGDARRARALRRARVHRRAAWLAAHASTVTLLHALVQPQFHTNASGAFSTTTPSLAASLTGSSPPPSFSTSAITAARSYIPAPYDQIVLHHALAQHQFATALSHAANANNSSAAIASCIANAHQSALRAATLLLDAMAQEKGTNWMLPVVDHVLTSYRILAYYADAERQRESSEASSSASAAAAAAAAASSDAAGGDEGDGTPASTAPNAFAAQDLIRRFLNIMVVDHSATNSKKMGAVSIIVHLFKIYFRIHNLKMCTSLIKMQSALPALATYPKAHRVAFLYYHGRLALFEEHYSRAEEYLREAFTLCHTQHTANKRRILTFLIPVALLHGKLPTDALLTKYGLSVVFADLIRSILLGNIVGFQRALDTHGELFIRNGIYLLLEKLKMHVYRNLFRIVHKHIHVPMVASGETTRKATQLPLDLLTAALQASGIEMSVEELECILANLIYDKHILGYIAHRQCLVLSANNPFPQLTAS